jgi:hypothetical protein
MLVTNSHWRALRVRKIYDLMVKAFRALIDESECQIKYMLDLFRYLLFIVH